MRKATSWWKILVVPVAVALAGQARPADADEPLILHGREPVMPWTPHEEVVYGPFPDHQWYFRAEALALKRDPRHRRQFAALGTDFDFVLNSGDVENEFKGGYRASLGRMLGDWNWLEFTIFDLRDWHEEAAVRNTTPNDLGGLGNLFSPFSIFGHPPDDLLDFNTFVGIESSSTLENMELNLWRRHPMPPGGLEVAYMAGLRYMNILEEFRYTSVSGAPSPPTTRVFTRTGNEILGVQLGALLEFPVDPGWCIDWVLKGAIAHNRADQVTQFLSIPSRGSTTEVLGRRDEARTVFVGETSVTLTYQWSPNLTAFVGYQAIWVDGLALALENMPDDANILRFGPAQLVHDGTTVYHGPHLGLTFTR